MPPSAASSGSASRPHAPSPRAVRSRVPSGRMLRIFERLKQEDYPNCASLARELETSSRTIQRDIDYMRDQLGLPIEDDASQHGFHFTQEVHSFPTIAVSQGELLALLVAQRAIEQYRGTPYHGQLETAFAKLLAPLDEMTGYAPTRDLISFKLIAPALHELTVFDLLTRAITEQHEISFDYRKLGAPAPAVRRVQPLHLTHREGRWYLIAQDLERSAMRTFALGRIADVTPTGKTFERPRDFSVDRYFAAALSVMNGRETHHVRLRFSRLAADDVRDRFFHESQAFHPQPDGSLDLTLTLADLLEVQRIVLQWGGHVIALEPAELRERIRALGETLVRSHASPSADDQRL